MMVIFFVPTLGIHRNPGYFVFESQFQRLRETSTIETGIQTNAKLVMRLSGSMIVNSLAPSSWHQVENPPQIQSGI